MSIHQNIEIDITMLTRYLAGEATPEEAMAVDDWLADDTNSKEFARLQQAWQLLPGNRVHHAPSPDVVWKDLSGALEEDSKPVNGRSLLIRYAMAAVISGVLLTAGLFAYVHITTEKDPVWQQALTDGTSSGVRKGQLADSSAVVINRNSSLQYAADYGQHDRKVLLQGEGYFDVIADKGKPFIVQAGMLKIMVLGTSFNVKEDSLSNRTIVTVATGKVKLYTAERELVVSAGQTGVYDQVTGTLTGISTLDQNSFSYVTRDFFFQDMPLPEICRHLENAFAVKIILDNAQLSQCSMSAHFKDRDVTYIMDIIAATLDVTYTMQDNTIHINGNGCN
ncbi:FecR domain-containing protein [Chitinophaga rhizophila]|uniref:DUF4974 domain-containing protein n=1 Tax=Chitinophaga rhizophila TaxID=2866212 RepID=A0ABS7GF27_9BACT|nr:FecR domain-containing protein [Chitinophaga rhizophila]MBW8685277.1 DUF4974 domain-containing protein [Chitinophaga rhizophila]